MVRSGFSPSVRLFEATACGVPVLSDRWAGIEDVLAPDRDLLVLDTAGDVVEALAMPANRRQSIGSAGRETTLRRHTGHRRAEELVHHLAGLNSRASV
jgi:spore maturation protein CgeB